MYLVWLWSGPVKIGFKTGFGQTLKHYSYRIIKLVPLVVLHDLGQRELPMPYAHTTVLLIYVYVRVI